MTLGVTIELVLAFLLVATIIYCYTLNTKISKILSLESEKNELVEVLNVKIEEGLKLRNQLESMLLEGARRDRTNAVRAELPRMKSPSMVPNIDESHGIAARARQLRDKRVAEIGHA
jgi:low affinity Fe/Cu permease